MNYYDRNPGDKAKHTPHLTMQQMGALVMMEDFCHGTEKLLPLDDDHFFRLIRAKSRSEKKRRADHSRRIFRENLRRMDQP